jgi:hypothetical protein
MPGPPRFCDRRADLPPHGLTVGRRPLSVFTYYLRNKRKVVPLLLIITLAVALMVVVQSLVASARDTAIAIYGSYSNVEVVAPRVKSQVDADKQLTDALALLSSERAAVASAAAAPPSTSVASLAQVLQQLRAVPGQLRAAEAAAAAAAQAAIPSTAPLQASLGTAATHGAGLQSDLTHLSAELKQAQKAQAQQQQLFQLLDQAQKQPQDVQALLTFLSHPHDLYALVRPDTTDYGQIAADAGSAAANAGALSADLAAVQAQVAGLAAVKPPAAPALPAIPALEASLPELPSAGDALARLGGQLDTLQVKLGAISGAQGDIASLEAAARKIPGVAAVERDSYAHIDLTLLAGDASFDLYGLGAPAMQSLLDLYGDHIAAGRLPRPDKPEIALSAEVARARGVRMGDVVGSDVNELDSLPEHFTIVGIIAGPTRLGLIPHQYMVNNYFFARRYQALLVIPQTGRIADIRAPLHQLIDKQPYRIFDGPFVAEKIDSLLVNLQHINDFLAIAVGLTLALVIGLLNNLYFRQRMNEFGLLAAIGYPRRQLALRVLLEGSLLVVAAWVAGGILGSVVLSLFNNSYMLPHGLVLRVFDPGILLRASVPVALMVLLFSVGTVMLQLFRLDPIAIIERRD